MRHSAPFSRAFDLKFLDNLLVCCKILPFFQLTHLNLSLCLTYLCVFVYIYTYINVSFCKAKRNSYILRGITKAMNGPRGFMRALYIILIIILGFFALVFGFASLFSLIDSLIELFITGLTAYGLGKLAGFVLGTYLSSAGLIYFIKKLRNTHDKEEAFTLYQKVSSLLDKLAKKNIIHKNKAANNKSKLSKLVKALQN